MLKVPCYKHTAMAAAVAALFPAALLPLVAGAAGVARVDFASGEVSAVAPDGKRRPLTKGSEIEVGESVVTQNGRAQLRFADGAYMSLQPQTEFKVEQFRFSGKADGSESIVMNLLKGGMRTITGLIGRSNRQNYVMRTDTATIGIRGTEYTVQYTNSIDVFVVLGSIFLQNDGGVLELTTGQGAHIANFQTAPQRSDAPPFLPPAGGGGQQQEQASNDPTNPLQDANPLLVQLFRPLTGTVSASWAATCSVCDGNQLWGANLLDSGTPVNAQVTFDGSGRATAFANALEGPFNVGTATAVSDGNDGIVAWGRWMNGVTGGTSTTMGNRTLNPNNPLHYVVGLPVTNMPVSGTATYTVIGYTPISGGLSGATLNTSQTAITVNFASSSASMSFGMDVGGQNFSSGFALTRTNQRFGAASTTGALFSGSGALLRGGSINDGFVSAQGFLAGSGASRAGAIFDASINSLEASGKGAIAFTKSGGGI